MKEDKKACADGPPPQGSLESTQGIPKILLNFRLNTWFTSFLSPIYLCVSAPSIIIPLSISLALSLSFSNLVDYDKDNATIKAIVNEVSSFDVGTPQASK